MQTDWREAVRDRLEDELGDAFTEEAYDAHLEVLEAESCLECDKLWQDCFCWRS